MLSFDEWADINNLSENGKAETRKAWQAATESARQEHAKRFKMLEDKYVALSQNDAMRVEKHERERAMMLFHALRTISQLSSDHVAVTLAKDMLNQYEDGL